MGQDQSMGGSSNTANKAPEDFTKSGFQNTNAIIERNKNVGTGAVAGKVAKGAEEQATGAINNMENRAAGYTKSAQEKANTAYVRPSDEDLSGAINGNQDAFGKVKSALNATPEQAASFDAGNFRPLDATSYLREGDVSGILQRQGGQGYTKGMSALDNLMFKRSGGVGELQKMVGGLQQNVDQTRNNLTGENGVQSQANKYAQDLVSGNKDYLNNYLSQQGSGIQSSLDSRLASAKDTNAQQALSLAGSQRQAVVDRVNQEIAKVQNMPGGRERAAELRKLIGSDWQNPDKNNSKQELVDKYLSLSNPDVGIGNVASQEEADKFNRIQELLGKGDRLTAAGGVAPTGSLKNKELEDAIFQAQLAGENQYNASQPKQQPGVVEVATGGNRGVTGDAGQPISSNPKNDILGDIGSAVKKPFKKLGNFLGL